MAKNAAVAFIGRMNADMRVAEQFVQQPGQIQAGGYAADRPGQDVIEHQRGDGNFASVEPIASLTTR